MNHRESLIDFTAFNSALIVAKNRNNEYESNGIGKTTILSAIEYALFGAVPTSVLEKIVRDGTDKCEVEFDFEFQNNKYRILRGRSKKGRSELRFWQEINDKWEPITERSMPETESKIADLIKISHKAFACSIKFAQYDLSNSIASADSSEHRKKIFKEPLQLSDYTKLEKIAKEKVNRTQKQIDAAETNISLLGAPSSDIERATTDLDYCKSVIVAKDAEIEKCKLSLVEKQKSLEELKKSVNSSDSELHENIARLQQRSEIVKNTVDKTHRTVLTSKDEAEKNSARAKEFEIKIEITCKELAEIDSEVVRDTKLISEDLKKVREDQLYGTKLLAQLEAEYDAANKSIPNGDLCPACKQQITLEHRKQCEDEVNAILGQKSKEIADINKNLDKCIKKLDKLQAELDNANKHNNIKSSLERELKSAQSQLEYCKTQSKAAEKRYLEATTELEAAQNEHKEVLERLNTLREAAKSSSLSDTNGKILALTDEIRLYERNLEQMRQDLKNIHSREGAAEAKIKIATENLTKLTTIKTELASLYEELAMQLMVHNAFGPNGIPTFIIHSILDEFQMESNKLLQVLRPELELRFDADLEMYYKVYGQERSFDQLSIGQKIYITLALKMGMSKVIQKRLGIDIRMLLLDEVEASLDHAGKQAYAEVVKKWSDDFCILIISHSDYIKDKFHHAILVEGDQQNGATSSVVTSW